MQTVPKLSIIIACYNDLQLPKAVEAAFSQTYDFKEIIVIDDGSNDATKNVIASVKDKIDILIDQKNSGQSIARNNGIKKATGKFILNWDSDDYFEPEFAERAIQKFEKDEAVKIVNCKARRFNKEGTIDIFTPRGGRLENFLFRNSALGSSMFKRVDWEACGGYEEELPILGFEDWEFYIQLLKQGGYAYVIPEVLFHYQIRPNSTTARIKHLKQEKFRYIILKHRELYKDNFEDLTNHLFDRISKIEDEKRRRESSIEFRIGSKLLFPLRKLKTFFH
ncbi:glycosyltransferase [uncultured Salegentibacter sp.]|uniref:glycosyltransferase n=1 Tax=uncultured Salegentibacter sp. TaxID=259320 RepID=UPI0025923C7D|nr:glycosyltransferase [uncultured Salegentibacter sp.]